MNSTSFHIAQFLKIFGINRKQARMNDAALELQLLREGEHFLGKALWKETEEYEAVGVPYWHLRQLNNRASEIQKNIQTLSEELASAQIQKKSINQSSNSLRNTKEEERIKLVGKAERLTMEKSSIAQKAQTCKQQYDALKLKIKVLTEENASDALIQKQRSKSDAIKQDFLSLKKKNSSVDKQLSELEVQIDLIEEDIRNQKTKLKESTSGAFDGLGKANKDLSNLRAEVGLIQSQMNQHYTELGNVISTQYKENSQCRTIAKKQKHLIAILAALRRSIEWNNDLAERH